MKKPDYLHSCRTSKFLKSKSTKASLLSHSRSLQIEVNKTGIVNGFQELVVEEAAREDLGVLEDV